ncbi:MAG: LacI family DNA-binding transcriptional regulator [Rudaea sp.]|nr:LacI family DNA-binding transcriptional regulator [Rudaea sp.]
MAVTIKDVAREARVSVASVSRALNGTPSVTEGTRARILGVAKRLRYMPHGAARSLITRRTNTIGALLPDLFGEFFSELIRGIDLAARSRGLHLLVSSSHGDATEAAAALRAMQGRVDGLLVMSPHVDAEFLHDNLPDSLPVVLMNTAMKNARYSTLNVDNFGGAFAITQHLIEHGHRHIALIAGPLNNFDAQQRDEGYRAAMKKCAPGLRSQVVAGDFSEEAGYRAGTELLAAQPRPSAVFAANDMMAVGCLYAFAQAGVRVPEDIAVAGFDDIPIARYVTPPLTTVRVRIADLGRSALERLALRLENSGESDASAQTLGYEIVVRRTCGAGGENAVAIERERNSQTINSESKPGRKP